MANENVRLSPKREQAAQMIAKGETQAAAARAVEVTPQSMWQWCRDPEFQQRIAFLRSDVHQQAAEILELGVIEAARTVVGIASGEMSPDQDPETGKIDTSGLNVRLRAALYILDKARKSKLPEPDSSRSSPSPAESLDDEEADSYLERLPKAKRR